MSQVVDKLWELQSVMSDLGEKEKALHSKPEDFAEIDSEYQNADQELSQLTTRLDVLGTERRAIERELQAEQDVLKKYQGQLMQVKNQVQYAAAWKEIDASRKKIKDLEDSLLRQMGESEEKQGELEKRNVSHAELKAKFDAAYQAWQGSLAELQKEIEEIRSKISGIEQVIPGNLRAEFHRIFKQRQGVAVTRVINESCGSCRVRIRPQTMQQLKRGEVAMCEGCRRIFYLQRPGS